MLAKHLNVCSSFSCSILYTSDSDAKGKPRALLLCSSLLADIFVCAVLRPCWPRFTRPRAVCLRRSARHVASLAFAMTCAGPFGVEERGAAGRYYAGRARTVGQSVWVSTRNEPKHQTHQTASTEGCFERALCTQRKMG